MINGIIFDTPFGHTALVYQDRVRRIFLPAPEIEALRAEMSPLSPRLVSRHPPFVTDLVSRIQSYLEGRYSASLPLEALDFSRCSPFQQEVLRVEYTIPFGQVRTYQWVAAQLGKPNAARAVGNALARNPFPLVIPCHRCIRSDGSLGGFQRPGLKQKLLKLEGIGV